MLAQLRRDPRTLALVLLVPSLLLTLFRYVFDGQPETFDRVGAPMVGIFPLVSMFLVTSIAMLRERTSGTLERLMSMPLAKLDLLLGYGLAFALVAVVQASLASAVAFGLLGLDVGGSVALVVALAVANALLGMALGLFLSRVRARRSSRPCSSCPRSSCRSSSSAACSSPRDQMAPVLELDLLRPAADVRLRRARRARTSGDVGAELALDVPSSPASIVVALALGAATLRRRTP